MTTRSGRAARNGQRLRRRRRWLSPAAQITLALAICVVIPFLLQAATLPQGWHEPEARHAAAASFAALVLGFWLQRNVGELPGTRESSGILPAYLLSFGFVLTIILLARISYSRALLSAGLVLTIAFFLVIYMVTQRHAVLTLGVADDGRTGPFDGMAGINPLPVTLGCWPDGIDAITADLEHNLGAEWEARLTDFALAGIPVYHSEDLRESLTGKADLTHLAGNNFGALGPQSSLLLAKLVFDRLLALPMLILLSPLFAILALAIRLETPGPAFFRQRRRGYRGREFTVLKFRTMIDGAGRPDDGDPADDRSSVAPLITTPNDPRVTRVGAVLRRSRLDELPQIVNILRGEMSWIGPRPEAAGLSAWYQRTIAFYRYRFVVRPGITGWAQVNQGHVAEIDDVRTKLQYDFYYIRNFSAWLDLLIVAKTMKTVLTGFGHR